MHKGQSINNLGSELSEGGMPHIEIDELGNENTVYWMFGMIYRSIKKCLIYCVLNNRARDTLIPVLKEIEFTNN